MKFINKKPHPTVTDTEISGFFEEYRWLSNFYPCDVCIDGITYASSEHAYVAQKTDDVEDRLYIASRWMNAKEVKAYGDKLTIREGWDELRVPEMLRVVTAKFKQNSDLREKLLETDSKQLIETNYWNDVFWGVCRGKGENTLGKVLMEVREVLRCQTQ